MLLDTNETKIQELERRLAAALALAKHWEAEFEKRAKGRVSVPPLTNCEMCGEANCCEGEWMDGSEIRCLGCGNVGAISAHEHSSGYTFWILSSTEEPDEEEAE